MSVDHVQLLYAVLTTVCFAVAITTVVNDNFPKLQRKPFNCVYCMTWYVAIILSMSMQPNPLVGFLLIPVTQILAWIIYQKAM